MFRSLRKGKSSVYLQHPNTGHSIGAENFEAEIQDGKVALRFALRPTSGHQRTDEDALHEQALVRVDLDDSHVVEQLSRHLQASKTAPRPWQLTIESRGKLFSYPATLTVRNQGDHRSLHFAIAQRDA